MRFHSAYLKLTAFYVLIIMTISIVFSVVIYQISSKEINRGFGRQTQKLREQTEIMLPNPIGKELDNLRADIVDESNNNLKNNLVMLNVIILVASAVGSYFFARYTLRPIEQNLEAQNRFTADASHELKTPLTAMRTEIEVNLRDKELNSTRAKKLLASNLEEIAKLETLSSALLKLAKYEDEAKKDFKKVDLTEIITEAYQKVEALALKKEIKFDNHFEKVEINGDRPSLIELFTILIDNAVKYSPKASKISIKIDKDGHHPTVTIKDHGIGIKASDLPHIFDRFYRADNSRCKEKCDGYGLGLSIAKSIIDLHGGKISVKSKASQGSQFTIEFTR